MHSLVSFYEEGYLFRTCVSRNAFCFLCDIRHKCVFGVCRCSAQVLAFFLGPSPPGETTEWALLVSCPALYLLPFMRLFEFAIVYVC